MPGPKTLLPLNHQCPDGKTTKSGAFFDPYLRKTKSPAMNLSDAQTLLGPLCALGSSLTWAIGSSVYTHQAGRVGAMEVNFSRAAIATPLFIVAAIVAGGLNSFSALQPSNLGWLSLSVVCSYGIGDMMFYMAALRLGTPTALAIGSIYPVWATLFGALTLGEQVGAQRILGTVLCIAGVVWLVLLQAVSRGNTVETTPSQARLAGLLLALLTSLFWAGNTYSVRRGGIGVAPFVVNGFRYLLASVVLGTLWSIRRQQIPKPPPDTAQLFSSRKELLRFAPAVVLEAFIGSSIFVYAMTHTDLSIATPLAALSPLFSVPIGLLMGSEKLDVRRLFAIVVTVGGVLCLVMA